MINYLASDVNTAGCLAWCKGYKKFFLHIRKYLQAMTQLLENGLPASCVMGKVKGPLVIKLDERGDGCYAAGPGGFYDWQQ